MLNEIRAVPFLLFQLARVGLGATILLAGFYLTVFAFWGISHDNFKKPLGLDHAVRHSLVSPVASATR